MRGKYLLHPNHIVPAVKFVAALYEVADIAVAEMSVKILAVSVKMLVCFARGYTDAGAEVVDIHFRKQFFERVIKLLAYAVLSVCHIDIYRGFDRVFICFSADKRTYIGVADYLSADLCADIRVFLLRFCYSRFKFLCRWRFIFKGYRRFENIRLVYLEIAFASETSANLTVISSFMNEHFLSGSIIALKVRNCKNNRTKIQT